MVNLKFKIFCKALSVWTLSIIFFLCASFYKEFLQIFKYSSGYINFFLDVYSYLKDFSGTLHVSLVLLVIFFSILLLYFYYTYIYISRTKIIKNSKNYNTKFGLVGAIFTYLGLGCVACGQTLLYSLLLLLGGNISLFLAPIIGELSLFLGIVFLLIGVYKNTKILNNKNICKL